ncbi:hypothetical protein ID866_8204 [Astraeus odoratus]|nr:hypothetical protein ID866_8204 [Astraeus odoratus]
MPSIVNLKFKGNKSFVAFSNLSDSESLTKTWKVCTKVASYLEQGQRLENLSWRLWHLQSLIVDADNAKSKREFKKLSKNMGDKLDREKGRSIEELEAPDFKRNASTDLICQRAVERERSREASQNAKPGTIKRMQFTFSIDQPTPAGPNVVSKPDLKPSPEFKETTIRRGRQATRGHVAGDEQASSDPTGADPGMKEISLSVGSRKRKNPSTSQEQPAPLKFPSLFSNDFGPSALLSVSPTLTTPMNYGEGVTNSSSSRSLSIMRPTIELPLDELLSALDSSSPPEESQSPAIQPQPDLHTGSDNDVIMQDTPPAVKEVAPPSTPQPAASTKVGPSAGTRGNTPNGRPSLTVKTQNAPATRSSGPGATATSVNPALLRGNGNNSAPGGVKAECSNCGATHTPLWRRGLNDELNCNACGLYCKLHKRPRPKSMRSNHSEGRNTATNVNSSNQAAPRQEVVEVTAGTAQCYNCHTTATPLWRKDDEGKTVCNACGLYYKLHGSARPISMKSDVIRKRSRHDARRSGPDSSDSPSASPGASRRASPNVERSPTLAPDSTTQPTYEFSEEPSTQTSSSELMGALGQEPSQTSGFAQGTYAHIFNPFPGPYHPDYLSQNFQISPDALPFASVEALESETQNNATEQRTTKRRRMSTDSASEPPSSAVSFSSYAESFSSATSHSRRSSMDFPFFAPYTVFRGSGNAFWHPPMLPADRSPQFIHPPMLPAEESTMDYLHPPMLPQEEDNLFATYLHPPMMLPPDDQHAQQNHQQQQQQQQQQQVQSQSMAQQSHQGYGGSTQPTEYYDSAMQTY